MAEKGALAFFTYSHAFFPLPSRRLAAVLPTHVVVLHIEIDSLRDIDGLILPIQFFALQRKIFSLLEDAVRLSSATPLFHTGQSYVAAIGLAVDRLRVPGNEHAAAPYTRLRGMRGTSQDPVIQAIDLMMYIRFKIREFNLKHHISLVVKVRRSRRRQSSVGFEAGATR